MSTVYVVQNAHRRDMATGALVPVHDLTPALRYGELRYLLPPGPVLLSTEHAVKALKQQLAEFTPDDYLLCIGDPSAIALVSMVASTVTAGRVKLLVWDKPSKAYIPVPIDLFPNR